jgi:hydrogenase expression/formation protein HypE
MSRRATVVPAGPLGKLPPELFERWIAGRLGATRPEVLVGPGVGRDSAVVRVGAGRIMAITTDPLSLIPALGPAASARLACHLLASDAWTSGIPPAFAACSFHFPPDLEDATIDAYLAALHAEWEALGIAVVAGHTGRYEGCGLTIVGAATLIGLGDEGRYLAPAFARSGDRILVTKGCAIEATAIAAHLFPERLGTKLDAEGLERARGLLSRVTVVEDCRALIHVGVRDRGVTCLHDATEGGVLGGLIELARASGRELRVEKARIPLADEARAACEVFGIDPYWTLSEGALLATVRPEKAKEALDSLAGAGIVAAEVGEVMGEGGTLWLTEADGRIGRLGVPENDPYWAAYSRAVQEGWK